MLVNNDIVIFQADKGAAVVVQNRKDYLAEAYKQLNGTDENGSRVYEPVSTDPTSDFVIRVKEAVQEAHSKEVINTDTANYLKMENAQPGNIYFLPKIHKPQRPPPARPICNTIKSATTNISKWIDDQLQPLVENLPSHLKDDNDFLGKLIELNNKHTLPPDTLLVTWDVKSLYTNIPHDGGIEACDYFMRLHNFAKDKRETIVKFINLVLTCNSLTFQGQHFVQQTGTAMGTKMAPCSYANLYMGRLEDHFLKGATDKPLMWFRYIDDIFFIWTHGEEKLTDFFNFCNSFDPHIKFEQTKSTTSIPFLDVQVINSNGKISTDLYTKPTDTHQYLNWTSCHPRHTKTSIPYSLALRLRRICSTNDFFEKRARELHNILLERGYKNKLIKECIMRARKTSREEAFQSKQNSSSDRVPLVVTYNPALPNLHIILKEPQQILDTSPKTQAIFKEPPLVAFRRGRSLSQMLTHKRLPSSNTSNTTSPSDHPTQQRSDWLPNPSDTTCSICGRSFQTNRNLKIHFTHKHKQQSPSTPSDPGFWPCRTDIRCACCKTYGQFTRTVTSNTTGETITLRQHTTCKTSNVIYLIECVKCSDQYVGETGHPVHHRGTQYRSDIKGGTKNIPSVRHFKNCGVQNLKLTVIERVRKQDQDIRK